MPRRSGDDGPSPRPVLLVPAARRAVDGARPSVRRALERAFALLAVDPTAGLPLLPPLQQARILAVPPGVKVVYLAGATTVRVAAVHVAPVLARRSDDTGVERFGAVVLAAGKDSCCGRPVQLCPVDGRPCVLAAVEPFTARSLADMVVVIGYQGTAVRRLLEVDTPLPARERMTLVAADDPTGPMSRSLQRGLRLADPTLDGLFLALGTRPRVRPATLAAIIEAFRRERPLAVRPRYHDRSGHPVLLTPPVAAAMQNLSRTGSARSVLERFGTDILDLDVDDPGVVTDIRQICR